MKRKYEKGTEKIKREPPAFQFGGEVNLVPCEVGSIVTTFALLIPSRSNQIA